MVSKAALRSSDTRSGGFPRSADNLALFSRVSRAVSVEWPSPVSGLEWVAVRRVDEVRLKPSQKEAFKDFWDIAEIRNRPVIWKASVFNFGFLRSGVIWAILKLDGKTPSTKERFARWAMSGEKVEEHNLISEVGMKSRLEDLGWVEWRSLETSADVTVVMVENRSPEWMGSCNGGGKLNWAILDVIDFFRLSILEVKKFKNEVDVILAVFAEVF